MRENLNHHFHSYRCIGSIEHSISIVKWVGIMQMITYLILLINTIIIFTITFLLCFLPSFSDLVFLRCSWNDIINKSSVITLFEGETFVNEKDYHVLANFVLWKKFHQWTHNLACKFSFRFRTEMLVLFNTFLEEFSNLFI
jgi:hypothetical protein